tara:strand:- start:50 stop:214 length:165 start_codon:yes stop_codon:yes gene_type:complete
MYKEIACEICGKKVDERGDWDWAFLANKFFIPVCVDCDSQYTIEELEQRLEVSL